MPPESCTRISRPIHSTSGAPPDLEVVRPDALRAEGIQHLPEVCGHEAVDGAEHGQLQVRGRAPHLPVVGRRRIGGTGGGIQGGSEGGRAGTGLISRWVGMDKLNCRGSVLQFVS
jgi:hypothetical protein